MLQTAAAECLSGLWTHRAGAAEESHLTALNSGTATALAGDIQVPGDKSISHRALIIGAMAVGETTIRGLLEGEDVLCTAAALKAMGVGIEAVGESHWRVHGVGVGGLAEPAEVLDLGNSGTGARLLIGLISTHPITAQLTGDASLCSRPMARVAEPVQRMGAQVLARSGGRMPLTVIGARDAVPIVYKLPVPSAQVKSAVLLAGLNTPGETTVVETAPSRDHTELMLRYFGAPIRIEDNEGDRSITLTGQVELSGREVVVPGDASSAAFPGVAALITEGSEVTIRNVGLNPLRTGLFRTLEEMGANITFANRTENAGEAVGDITFRTSRLQGVEVPADRAPSMIDEYPILAVAAAAAHGRTRMHGLEELRVKESDRLGAIVEGLGRCGVSVAEQGDSLVIEGAGGPPAGGAAVAAKSDHRIAMSFLLLGAAARAPVVIDDGGAIGTSFPGFIGLMNSIGANISEADGSA